MYIVTSLRVKPTEQLDQFLTNGVHDGPRSTPADRSPIPYGKGLADVSPAAALGRLYWLGRSGRGWRRPGRRSKSLRCVAHDPARRLTPETIDSVKLAILSPSIADGVRGWLASNPGMPYGQECSACSMHRLDRLRFRAACALPRWSVLSAATGAAGHGRPSDSLRGALAIVVEARCRRSGRSSPASTRSPTRVERERLGSDHSATKLLRLHAFAHRPARCSIRR